MAYPIDPQLDFDISDRFDVDDMHEIDVSLDDDLGDDDISTDVSSTTDYPHGSGAGGDRIHERGDPEDLEEIEQLQSNAMLFFISNTIYCFIFHIIFRIRRSIS